MHRFFIDPKSISENYFSSHDSDLCHQLSRVLKLQAKEPIILLDNVLREYECELQEVNPQKVQGKILHVTQKPDISEKCSIHLFVPPLKNPARWEWMLEKCTEIGVASFTPLITQRTEVKSLRKLERLGRIIKEAAEQSGRTKLPVIHEPVVFKSMLKNPPWSKLSHRFLFTLLPSAKLLSSYHLSPKRNKQEPITYHLLFGPVGDFTENEVSWALDEGFHPVSLGSQILRSETAALVASSLFLP